MGMIRNEVTIVHDWELKRLKKLHKNAMEYFSEIEKIYEVDIDMISPIMKSVMNEEYTFVINGDCSKVDWKMSERFHEARMKWCEEHKNEVEAIIVVNFGEGDMPCEVVFDSTGMK